MTGLLPLYLRREPTLDPVAIQHKASFRGGRLPKDVVAYRDSECTVRAFCCPWHYSTKPRRNQRRVTFNCWIWEARWLPDKEEPNA